MGAVFSFFSFMSILEAWQISWDILPCLGSLHKLPFSISSRAVSVRTKGL